MRQKLMGQPVEKKGYRLAFFSSDDGEIHIAQPPKTGRLNRRWAACDKGGRQSQPLYVKPSEVGDDKIKRKGQTIGDLCSGCSEGFEANE